MAGGRKKHSEDFKRDAVALSYNSEKSMAEIARYLCIHRSILVRWRKEHSELGERVFPGNGLR
jgi:transposase